MTSRSQKLLTTLVVLQGSCLLSYWLGGSTAQARGEINLPDPGQRQLTMIDELKSINAKLDKLTTTMTSGEMRVKVEKDEK